MRFPDLNHPRNKKCKNCGGRFWREKTLNCCNKGTSVIHRLKPLPEGITDTNSQRSFQKRQKNIQFNFAFTALGASPGQTWTQPSYPSILKLCGRPYHRIMDAFRGTYEGTVSNNSRMNIFEIELQNRAKKLKLDEHTVTSVAGEQKQKNLGCRSTVPFFLKSTKPQTITCISPSKRPPV